MPGGAPGRLADEDAVHRCGGLEARCRVDDVARGHALARFRTRTECDQRLARIHRDPHLKLLFLLAHPVADRERGSHGSLGVVLVGDWRAEERHDRIADELLDSAAEELELGAQACVVRTEQRSHVLGIHVLRARREADEIGEQDRHDLPLLTRLGGRRLAEAAAARQAESCVVRVLSAALSASDHRLRVRRSRHQF